MPPSRQAPAPPSPLARWTRRIAAGLALALFVGTASGAAMRWESRRTAPPGFYRGLLHGALMPLAWPTLLLGRDQSIYSIPNSGRTYKLGYSLGVNACGAVFFGWFFTRLRRWSRSASVPPVNPKPEPPTTPDATA